MMHPVPKQCLPDDDPDDPDFMSNEDPAADFVESYSRVMQQPFVTLKHIFQLIGMLQKVPNPHRPYGSRKKLEELAHRLMRPPMPIVRCPHLVPPAPLSRHFPNSLPPSTSSPLSRHFPYYAPCLQPPPKEDNEGHHQVSISSHPKVAAPEDKAEDQVAAAEDKAEDQVPQLELPAEDGDEAEDKHPRLVAGDSGKNLM